MKWRCTTENNQWNDSSNDITLKIVISPERGKVTQITIGS